MFILVNLDSAIPLYYGPFSSRTAAETGAADLGLELYRIQALLNSKVCQSYGEAAGSENSEPASASQTWNASTHPPEHSDTVA